MSLNRRQLGAITYLDGVIDTTDRYHRIRVNSRAVLDNIHDAAVSVPDSN